MSLRLEGKEKRKRPVVLVDADACPVKDEIKRITNSFDLQFLFVASYDHYNLHSEDEQWKFVDSVKESADLYIANSVRKGDCVVTQDLGLAASLIGKGVYVLTPRGKIIEEEELDSLLFFRYASAKARRNGERTKGPRPFTNEDREHFSRIFQQILSKLAGK